MANLYVQLLELQDVVYPKLNIIYHIAFGISCYCHGLHIIGTFVKEIVSSCQVQMPSQIFCSQVFFFPVPRTIHSQYITTNIIYESVRLATSSAALLKVKNHLLFIQQHNAYLMYVLALPEATNEYILNFIDYMNINC